MRRYVLSRAASSWASSSATPSAMNWNFPTPVRFGPGRVVELPDACRELGIERPLLVTDPGIAALSMVGAAVDVCEAAGLKTALFSSVQPNPTEQNVTDGVACFKEHECDGVIAFGGGSAMDAAKCVALMAGQTRPLFDFEDREDWCTRVDEAGMVPCVAVPTTAGTGSEVGRASVITDERDHTKKIIFHANMLPGKVILDPELTFGLPANITAFVGIDALSHSMEAFSSPHYHPMAQGIALEGMRLVKEFLPAACADGNDVRARSQMMVASTLGATAFQKGLGGMHSLTHAAGGLLNTGHGETISIVMPYVAQFNKPAVDGLFCDLGRYLGLENATHTGVLDWILELRDELGVAHTLGEIGVTEEHVAALAPVAVADPSSGSNPLPLDIANVTALYEQALSGRM